MSDISLQRGSRLRSEKRIAFGTAFMGVVLLGVVFVLAAQAFAQAVPGQADVPETMMGPAWMVWLVGLGLLAAVLLNALYVAAETALEVLRPLHVKHVQEKNGGRSERLQWMMDHRPSLIAACTLGRQVSKLTLVFLSLLLAYGLALSMSRSAGWSFTYGTILVSALFILLPVGLINLIVELIPKSYAALHPHRIALRLYRFVSVSSTLFAIPARLVTSVANLLTSRFGGRASFEIQNQAEEEIKTLVESAEEAGEIEVEERQLLHSVFDFADTVAREVMTPRVDLDAMPVRSDPRAVISLIEETGHSRIPLYEETDDQIVGIVHAKDLLLAAAADGVENVSLRRLMRPALFVPENKPLHELLSELRASRTQMAIVQDEFGGTAGVVTIEDIVEELVGDIMDEYDVEEPEIVELEGHYVASGKAHLDDVNEALRADFRSDEFDTIGGYVFGLFGRQPRQGECIESDGWNFCVSDTDGRRINRLRIERLPVPAEPEMADVGD